MFKAELLVTSVCPKLYRETGMGPIHLWLPEKSTGKKVLTKLDAIKNQKLKLWAGKLGFISWFLICDMCVKDIFSSAVI